MNYVPYSQPTFDRDLQRLNTSDRRMIDKVVNGKLAVAPYRGAGNKGHLVGEFKGMRRIRIGRSGYRIIFAICEECKKLGFELIIKCADCRDMPRNAVKLFRVDKRPSIY